MAKSKAKSKVVDDEELPEEIDVEPEEVESDPDDAEPEPDEVEGEPEDKIEERPRPPKPRLTWMVIVLLLLNWVAAPAFLYVAYMDHVVRLQYSYRTLLNYVTVWGLPLQSEEENASLSTETRPRIRLNSEQLTKAFKSRKGVVSFTGEYASVEEPVPVRLRPSDMIDELVTDIFRDLPDPVKTLEGEIELLKTQLPKRIEEAADEVLKKQKDDNDKRLVVEKTLLPLAWDVWQVEKLDKTLNDAKGADLDKLVMDSVQRRIYYDIMAPLNVFRAGDLSKFQIEKMADQSVSLEQIKEYMEKRLSATIADTFDPKVYAGENYFEANVKRDSVEKRQKIAFLMFTLSQVEKPTLNEKLYKRGVERAQTICGLHEVTNAAIHYVRTLRILEDRIASNIKSAREGDTFTSKTGITRTEGFGDKFEAEVDRLVNIAGHIDTAQKRLADLSKKKDQFQLIHDQRKKHLAVTMDKLLTARKSTEKYMKDLRELQDQLHEALVELSDAADRNFRLEAEIRRIELDYIQKNTPKGGKK